MSDHSIEDKVLKLLNIDDESLSNYIRGLQSVTLQDYLNDLLKIKKLSKSQVIEKSLLDKHYAYQIFQGIRNPSREKIIALGVALKCTHDEVNRLLQLGHQAILFVQHARDALIAVGIQRGYNMLQMNQLLYDFDQPILNE